MTPSNRTRKMRTRNLLAAGVILGTFACTKSGQNPADSLALAAKNQATLDSISAAERAAATPAPAALAPAPAPTTVPARTPTRTRTVYVPERTSTRRATSSGGGTTTTTTTTTTTGGTVVKHTKRDAEIGAAAGAVIGAVTSRNKVKGAVVGG